MKQKQNLRGEVTAAVEVCKRCHHPESEHGRNGSRPCMAVVGELGNREFCACDEFVTRASAALAA